MHVMNPDVNAVVVDMSEQALKQAHVADVAIKKGKKLGNCQMLSHHTFPVEYSRAGKAAPRVSCAMGCRVVFIPAQ